VRITRKTFLHSAAATALGAAVPAAVPIDARAAGRLAPKKVEGTAIAGATDAVARFIAATTLSSMPADVVLQAKRCLVDGFGVMLAGSTVRGSEIIREYVRATGAVRESTTIGAGSLMASAAHAALVNAGSGHAMDYDDTQLSTTPDRTFGLLTHPTVPVLAAALAVAERRHASGTAFLEAFLIGFEVECKIAEAIDPDHYERGFHSTGTIGTFGAAAAAAKLMGLAGGQLHHMLAIAASMSSGIRVNFGSMTKPLHAGRAAENGVVAAELASRGFTGGDEGLDGRWGFFQVFGGGADLDRLLPALGKPFSIVNPGVSVKPYPCGSLSHPSMDAMLKAVTDHDLKPDQIGAVRLRAGSNVLEPLRYKTAKNELEAKFCLPFLLTSIILRRKAGVREFTDEFVASEPVQRMMMRVTTMFDPAIEARGFDKIRSIVEIDLLDGRRIVQPSDDRYRGGPDRPFTRDELHEKFTDCAELTLPADRARQALTRIEGIEEGLRRRRASRNWSAQWWLNDDGLNDDG
jgi:2-methylcitrate dehydratase PrpD